MSSDLPSRGGPIPAFGDDPSQRIERLQRYRLAASVVRGRVLELGASAAEGFGEGGGLLAQRARLHVALDRWLAPLAGAQEIPSQAWGARHLRVLGSRSALPFGDGSFDSVVALSCRAIGDPVGGSERGGGEGRMEHGDLERTGGSGEEEGAMSSEGLPLGETLLDEILRVLTPDGVAVIAVPCPRPLGSFEQLAPGGERPGRRRRISHPGLPVADRGGEGAPFGESLRATLLGSFRRVEIHGQGVVTASWLRPLGAAQAAPDAPEAEAGADLAPVLIADERPQWLVAVCRGPRPGGEAPATLEPAAELPTVPAQNTVGRSPIPAAPGGPSGASPGGGPSYPPPAHAIADEVAAFERRIRTLGEGAPGDPLGLAELEDRSMALATIHGSRMWSWWTRYHALRQSVRQSLGGLGGRLRGRGKTVAGPGGSEPAAGPSSGLPGEAGEAAAVQVVAVELAAREATVQEMTIQEMTIQEMTVPGVTVPGVTVQEMKVQEAMLEDAAVPETSSPEVAAPRDPAPFEPAPPATPPETAAAEVRAGEAAASPEEAAAEPSPKPPALPQRLWRRGREAVRWRAEAVGRRARSGAGRGRRFVGGALGRTRGALGRVVRSRLLPRPLAWIPQGLGALALLLHYLSRETRARAVRGAWRLRGGTRLRKAVTPSAPGLEAAGERGERPLRVLMVCPYPIYPADHGGGVRLFNLVRRLAREVELHLLIFIRADDDPVQREALEPLVASLEFHHWRPALPPDLWGMKPPSARLFESDEVSRRIAHLLSERRIDILQLEYTELGQYGDPRWARVKVCLSEIDITFRSRSRRRAAGFHQRYQDDRIFGHSRLDFLRQFHYEVGAARRADQVHVMSVDDGEYLGSYLPETVRDIRVVPNGVDIDFHRPPEAPVGGRSVLFVGNFQHLPNRDGLDWFVEEVWETVRQRLPGVELIVVGANAGPEVFALGERPGVTVLGKVPDLRPHYTGHRALVAPIRAGSGTRLKILEAMASGLPVISTTIGAEGIAHTPEENLLLADDAAGFAEAVARLVEDDALYGRLAEGGRRLAVDLYSWDRCAEAMLEGWRELVPAEQLAEPAPRRPVKALEKAPEKAPTPRAAKAPATAPADGNANGNGDVPDVSIIIPTLNGGELLEKTLEAIRSQETDQSVELVCVDSGSREEDLAAMERHGARVIPIDRSTFNHGLTRDLGARHSNGRLLVFLNQDAVPSHDGWLDALTGPLRNGSAHAGVQGAIFEMPDPDERFYWDSCGHRFYFTRESDRWIESYFGIGFSTVNAAIHRDVWERHPFGEAAIMEDKKWQRAVVDRGHSITVAPDAAVFHTHNYGWSQLVRRCQSEGYGWRLLGERYRLGDMVRDMAQPRVWWDLGKGLASRRARTPAEIAFPVLRPLMLWWGNTWARGVKH